MLKSCISNAKNDSLMAPSPQLLNDDKYYILVIMIICIFGQERVLPVHEPVHAETVPED